MALVGVLYLLFEKSIIPPSTTSDLASPTVDGISRSILGVQTGLIALAMMVTRSSSISLQAKRGLPLGNQVVGWLVLSMSTYENPGVRGRSLTKPKSHPSPSPSFIASNQTTTTSTASS